MRRFFHGLSNAAVLVSAILYVGWTALATEIAGAAEPHIALLLPLNSAAFGHAADAVKQGFSAAANVAGKDALPVKIYAADEDSGNLLETYQQAINAGAQLVVGPLTRNGVAALAASKLITVPTLALNAIDSNDALPPKLYSFGLGLEFEARQAAQLAFDDGRRAAVLIGDDSALSKRMREAFESEFTHLGGSISMALSYSADSNVLVKLREDPGLAGADSGFLALDYAHAVVIRPFLPAALALYATSQVNAGKSLLAAHELNQVRFVDMPWLLQPDHPAVMIYPHPQFGAAMDFQRLYALGVDALRIGLEILKQNRDLPLDGVTGRIRLAADRQFTRELVAAQFLDGNITVLHANQP